MIFWVVSLCRSQEPFLVSVMLLIRMVRSSSHAPFVAFGHSPLQPVFGSLHYASSPLVAVKRNGPGGNFAEKKIQVYRHLLPS